MDANLAEQQSAITPDAAHFLLWAAEYTVDHLNGQEEPESVLALRTAIAKALGND